jgi:hypothetical protein
MAWAGRPSSFGPPSLDRAFMLGNEFIAASEEISEAAQSVSGARAGWRHFVAGTGLSARSVRRYMAFARWANENTEDFALLLHWAEQQNKGRMFPRQPSYLIAPRVAALLRLPRKRG